MSNHKKQIHYVSEFKESVEKLAIEYDQSVSKAADELGENSSTLHNLDKQVPQFQKAGQVNDEDQSVLAYRFKTRHSSFNASMHKTRRMICYPGPKVPRDRQFPGVNYYSAGQVRERGPQ